MSGETQREQVLAAIRVSLGDCRAASAREYENLPRSYMRSGTRDAEGRLALFQERLEDYGVSVRRVAAGEIATAIGERLSARGVQRVAIPSGLPREWLLPAIAAIVADDLSALEMDKLDGVLTACTVAIAETGTIVLQTGPAQGPRRLSLVPDYHLCVVAASQIVETVPEAVARLENTLPTTFISGPSATSDIEMTRISGVHGPRTLDVLVIVNSQP